MEFHEFYLIPKPSDEIQKNLHHRLTDQFQTLMTFGGTQNIIAAYRFASLDADVEFHEISDLNNLKKKLFHGIFNNNINWGVLEITKSCM